MWTLNIIGDYMVVGFLPFHFYVYADKMTTKKDTFKIINKYINV